MERRNHDRRFPIGVNQTRIEEFWCAIKPLEKWDIWNREREREREDRSLYGVGSRSPVSRKRERHRKKLARVEWYAAAIVPRETVSHIIQLYFYWKMKKEGGRRQAGRFHLARDVRLSHKGATRPLFYALSGFMVYELPRGLAPSILIPVSMGRSTVFLTSLE